MSARTPADRQDNGMIVSRHPIDFTGDTDTFERQARQEALVHARDDSNREFPVIRETRHAHARVFHENRYSIRSYVSEREGKGFWDVFRVSESMVVMIGDCAYHEPKWFGTPDEGYFKIRLLWSGKFLTADGGKLLDSPRGMLAIYPHLNQDGYFIAHGSHCRTIILHCRISMLWEELGLDPSSSVAQVFERAQQGGSGTPYRQGIDLTPGLLNCGSALLDSRDDYALGLREWFVEAKAREIIAYVIQGFVQEPEIRVDSNRITRGDRHRILEVQEIIKSNLSDLPDILTLSRMVGINRTKLKSGFKAIVGSTIGEYMRQQQMEAAVHLLRSTEQPISNISFAVGYRHPANFSHAFKQYYGYLPSSLRNRGRDLRGNDGLAGIQG